jgi:phosphocarrier protein HPr
MIVTVLVGSASGLHARAAARVAAVAASCQTPVWVRRDDGKPVPADSVLSLLTLAATFGTELTLESSSVVDLSLVAQAIAAHDGFVPDSLGGVAG